MPQRRRYRTLNLSRASRQNQLDIRTGAILDAKRLWDHLDKDDPLQDATAFVRTLARVVLDARSESGLQALSDYNSLRDELRPGNDHFQIDTPGANELRLLGSLMITGPARAARLISQGTSPQRAHDQAFKLLANAISSSVLEGGRLVTEVTIRKDPLCIGFARVPKGEDACAFCIMLASRGAVYKTDTALLTKQGEDYHEGCSCTKLAVFDQDQELPQIIHNAKKLYENNSDGFSGLSTKQALALFRERTGLK